MNLVDSVQQDRLKQPRYELKQKEQLQPFYCESENRSWMEMGPVGFPLSS